MKQAGLTFEDQLETVITQYSSKGLLILKKVSPPARIIGRRVIFMENPFLDFAGCWMERQGRALFLEAKHTEKDQLPINQDSGLREKQVRALRSWLSYGAATGVLWQFKESVRFVSVPLIVRTLAERKHIKWDEAEPVKQGMGFIYYDFIQNLRHHFP